MKKYILGVLIFFGLGVAVYAINSQMTGFKVAKNTETKIDVHNNCKKVTNTSSIGEAFIPTKTKAEWDDVIAKNPSHLSFGECVEKKGYIAFISDYSNKLNNHGNSNRLPSGYTWTYYYENFSYFKDRKILSPSWQLFDESHNLIVGGYTGGVDYIKELRYATIDMKTGEILSLGGTVPSDKFGYIDIISANANRAYAGLKSDGTVKCFGGDSDMFCKNTPTDSGYVRIYTNGMDFAALKSDGSIKVWGLHISTRPYIVPQDSGYAKIFPVEGQFLGEGGFIGLKDNGILQSWGGEGLGNILASGYQKVYTNQSSFAALKSDGTILVGGDKNFGGLQSLAPSDSGYIDIFSSRSTFVALKRNGALSCWGYTPSYWIEHACSRVPSGSGHKKVYSNDYSYAAIKSDGTVTSWGISSYGGTGAPVDNGYTHIYSTYNAFMALKSDGTSYCWGGQYSNGKCN